MRFSKYSLALLTLLFLLGCGKDNAETAAKKPAIDSILQKADSSEISFFIISDWGRNGYFYQKEVAERMGIFAETIEAPDFILSCGDNFQVHGVASTSDALWMRNYENIYTHPSLEADWYPVLGNHDYQGSTQAQIDYSGISRRWNMKDHYYTLVKPVNDSTRIRFLFIDTPPLISSYRMSTEKYPDAHLQDSGKQMQWIRRTLSEATEEWIVVVGHHPVYSASQKHGDTEELITKLQSLFEKYRVDLYLCGHDHDMQHLRPEGSTVDYVVTGTGATVRPCAVNENSIISLSEPGFTQVFIQHDTLYLNFIRKDGARLYTMKQFID
ncbi:MAG: metallophosphoesterase [Bacteroidales bacterium]|nr:metallophosphoesterase [Bacteroidales bacterium]